MTSRYGGVPASKYGGIREDDQPVLAEAPKESSILDMAIGGTEVLGTVATGLVATPYAGAKALAEEVYRATKGDYDNLDEMVKTIEKTQQALTYMPKTADGKVMMEGVSKPFQWIEEKKKALGQWVTDTTGSPELGTLAYTAPDAALMFLGTNPAQAMKMKLGARDLQKKADELGIDLNTTKSIQAGQLAEVADSRVAQFKGEASPQVVKSVQNAKVVADRVVSMMYDKARQGTAGVDTTELNKTLAPMIVDSLEGFDVPKLPIVMDRLNELTDIASRPWAAATVNELEAWRIRVNRHAPHVGDRTQQHALGIMKAQYDKFMEHQFINDMIVGDKAVVENWRLARGARRRVGEMFDDNKVINTMIQKKMTVEETRALLFGSSNAGFKSQASSSVKAIKQIIGKNSPAMKALHDDALLNILDPLLLEKPNLAAFSKNYRDVALKNRSLLKELFDDAELRDMDAFAKGIAKHGTDDVTVLGSANLFIARMGVGHGIAKGQARIAVTKGFLDLLTKSAGRGTRKKIMQEILGYDPETYLFPASAPIKGAVLEAGAAQEQ